MTDSMTPRKTFHGFGAEIYDLWWPEGSVGGDEKFYKHFLSLQGGSALEVGCGTGRVLINFLHEGLKVDGLDYSQDMLNICAQKLRAENLQSELFCFPMQDFSINKSYDSIIIPFHSFMIVPSRDEAFAALSCFFKHLNPGGQILISLFVPNYSSLAKYTFEHDEWRPCGEIFDELGRKIVISDNVRNYHYEQLKHVRHRFELYDSDKVIYSEIEEMKMRWYFHNEFELMLRVIGFQGIEVYGDFSLEPLREGHREMIFRAFKPA